MGRSGHWHLRWWAVMIATTPEPPYVAVIFTAQRTDVAAGYDETVAAMQAGAAAQPGYLGFESAMDTHGFEITVSYWRTEHDAAAWKQVTAHLTAQARGRADWYSAYQVGVATVTRSYAFER
jgi:heme-degrading monooxygenase HmoA